MNELSLIIAVNLFFSVPQCEMHEQPRASWEETLSSSSVPPGHVLRDISRQSPSCKLAACYTGLDIKLCGFQNRESNLGVAVGTLLGTANPINTTGRKSRGIPVTSELD